MAKTSEGKVVWLEKGNSSAGLTHILERHTGHFADIGVSQTEIPDVIMAAIKQNKVIGINKGAKVYEVTYKGIAEKVQVAISSNGFIVQSTINHNNFTPIR